MYSGGGNMKKMLEMYNELITRLILWCYSIIVLATNRECCGLNVLADGCINLDYHWFLAGYSAVATKTLPSHRARIWTCTLLPLLEHIFECRALTCGRIVLRWGVFETFISVKNLSTPSTAALLHAHLNLFQAGRWQQAHTLFLSLWVPVGDLVLFYDSSSASASWGKINENRRHKPWPLLELGRIVHVCGNPFCSRSAGGWIRKRRL